MSKVLLNNVKQYKKRDCSMDQYGGACKFNQEKHLKLPLIGNQANNQNQVEKSNHIIKYLKSRAVPLEEGILQKKTHIRMVSQEQIKIEGCAKLLIEDPKERARFNLISDYGLNIETYLKKLSEINRMQEGHLSNHKITGVYRAKMVDWMVEVLTAFKCSDQTFFLAVNLMDRYFSKLNSGEQKRMLELNELHITGVTCMFIASKYEDVYPLLMKTVFNKIGHKKVTVEAIREREIDILRVLGFKVGAYPSPLEFLQKYMNEVLNNHKDKSFIQMMSVYLAKMAVHQEYFSVKDSHLIGAASIYVALKICEQMRQKQILTKEILMDLLKVSAIEENELIDISKKLLHLAQNFEKEQPGLENLKNAYIPQLNKFVQQ